MNESLQILNRSITSLAILKVNWGERRVDYIESAD